MSDHELLQFFVCNHLPDKLARVSEPFCTLAYDLVALTADEFPDRGPPLLRAARDRWALSAVTNPEEAWASTKLNDAWKRARSQDFTTHEARLNRILRLVLEAKDCAVRAMLYQARPPASLYKPQAGG